MTLQSDRLAMAALGVVGDTPPDAIQPPLDDGIHLRWARRQDLGFPWYGFYLFRREHLVGKELCLSPVLRSTSPGPWPSNRFATPYGELISEVDLEFTDDFAAAGTPEVDLSGRAGVRFAFAPPSYARRVRATIGLRADVGAEPQRVCADLSKQSPGARPNPYEMSGVQFRVAGSPQCQIRAWPVAGAKRSGLDCGQRCEIVLPEPTEAVWLELTSFARPATAVALDAAGARIAAATMKAKPRETETVLLKHPGIVRVLIAAEADELALHEVCYLGPRGPAPIAVTALDGQTPLGSVTATGAAGSEQTVELEFDLVTAVDISGGPAALVDLCFVAVSQGASAGWQPVPNVTQPIALPVQDPRYPARQGPPDQAGSEALALSRIHYGPPTPWGGSAFADLYDQLATLVGGGPSGPSMASYATQLTGTPDPPDPQYDPPQMPEVHPLDLVTLSALNPAVAQMLGLYWNDDTADPAKSYDYLVLADDTGVARLDPNQALAEVRQGFTQLDGWIVFNQRRQAAASLQAPADVRSYALPASPIQLAGGQTLDASFAAGLTWQRQLTSIGTLAAGAAVMFHLWRADLGDGANPAAVTGWVLQTTDMPLLVADAALPAGTSVEYPDDWPPFALSYTQSGLAEGWYGYAATGIDIFGRHSPRSDPAAWHQWAPEPDPRPWYYVEPSGDAVVHPSAVRLLDTIPPPPPTAVAAWALDPADPLLVQDSSYQAWWATLSAAEQQSLLGLRVKWEWTHRHMLQAPDTREFRIYFNPGSDPPADAGDEHSWQARYYVCAYGDHVTVGVDADGNPLRTYEVFVPEPSDAQRPSLPLNPTRADPLEYALIGVSAADDKVHATDDPKWAGTTWGDRYGNEGPVGAPARIYRVLREPPDPPVPPPADSDAVFATPADYHARSFYTYRWRAQAHVKAHIVRALDDAVFREDWTRRPRAAIAASDTQLFPAETDEPRWDATKRSQVATEINALNSLTATSFQGARTSYGQLSNDALRVLAGLPEVTRAFGQLTIQPLDPDDSDNADRIGPDDDATYQPQTGLRAFLDTLDGRSTNRYFYRCLYVDAVNNRSGFSLASPPVCLPNVVPPRAPSLTGLAAGDLTVTVEWASNREPDLQGYRVYRAGSQDDARDLRLMALVHTESGVAGDPAARPGTVQWDDTSVAGATTYWYRLTAVDDAGNESAPTPAAAGRAYDDSRPDPPTWDQPVLDPATGDAALSWTAADQDLACLVERQLRGATLWEQASRWLTRGVYGFTDANRVAGLTYTYRLRVRDQRGRTNRDFNTVSA